MHIICVYEYNTCKYETTIAYAYVSMYVVFACAMCLHVHICSCFCVYDSVKVFMYVCIYVCM